MAKLNEKQFIDDILGDSFTVQIIKELGMQENSAEEKANVIAMLGENIFKRVMLEIYTVVPKDAHDTLEAFLGANNPDGMREFLLTHIPDLDRFIHHEATKEYESTKTRAQMILQGIE